MFITTDSGRLQNLYYLQDVKVVSCEEKYYIGWVQVNGVIIKDGEFNTEEAANAKLEEIKEELLGQEG